MHGPEGQLRVSVPAVAPDELAHTPELILLTTKAHQSANALKGIASVIGPQSAVLSIQNGLGNIETISQFVPNNRILAATTMLPIDVLAPGQVAARGEGVTYFGTAQSNAELETLCVDLFSTTTLDIHCVDNILQRIWTKVAFNTGMNAVCALSRTTPGALIQGNGVIALVQQAATEAASVASAEGINVDLHQIFATIDFACREHGKHQPSMLQDVLAQRQTEIDALNGEVLRRAERAEIDVPVNRMLYALVKLTEDNYT